MAKPKKPVAELSKPEQVGRPFPKGQSGNPGGQSKEKRALLDRLTTDDAETIYGAFMGLVRDGNVPAILRALEYAVGKPRNAPEDNDALAKAGLTIVVQRLAEPKEPVSD